MKRLKINLMIVVLSFYLLSFSDFSYSQERVIKYDRSRIETVNEGGKKIKKGKSEFVEYDGRLDGSGKSRTADKTYSRDTRNYFRIDRSGNTLWNGKHWQPEQFPLRVFVKSSESEYYKDIYKDYIEYSFKVWQLADERIKYKYVRSAAEANIIISFEDNLMDKYEENYLGLTDYELGHNREIKLSTIEIGLVKFKNERLSDGEIKATILHEIGHALGLGHSNNSADLMYPYIDPGSKIEMDYDELSNGDKEAIRSVINLCYDMEYSTN